MSTKHQIKHALERIAASIDVSPDGCWLWPHRMAVAAPTERTGMKITKDMLRMAGAI